MKARHTRIYGLILLNFWLGIRSYGQNTKPDFGSPVNIPILLAGNFCEIRPNHFHSGIDIRTNGKEGLPIFSIGNGYVSRIKVSPTGFGRVIYINHPEGYTSVYAHLSSFNSPIDAYVDSIQKSTESYDMEVFPDAKQFPVTKGDTIAFSGNSGSSASPHLHFEIRDLKSEEPLNPLAFLNYVDNKPPTIKNIRIVYKNDKNIYKVLSDLYFSDDYDDLSVIQGVDYGEYFFELMGTDNSEDALMNFYSITVYTNSGDTLFFNQFDRFNFDETRMVNSFINYSTLVNDKEEWLRLYKLPGNSSSIFKNCISKPLIVSEETDTIFFKVTDYNANSTTVKVFVHGTEINKTEEKTDDLVCRFYNESFSFPFKYGFVNIPANGIDNSFCYSLTDYDTIPDTTTFLIGDPSVPLLKNAVVVIQKKLNNNFWLCERNNKNELTGTSYKLDSAKYGYQTIIKKMGWYSLEQDSVAPQLIKILSEYDPIIPKQKNTLLKISDDISGVKKANVFINNKFVPCEFDLKNSIVIIKGICFNKTDNIDLLLIDYQGNSNKLAHIKIN